MSKNKNTKEKICAFYASDYHFEIISLPYIDQKMENKDEIVILTQNNLEETIKTLLSKTNLQEEKKEEIIKLNWNNNNEEKIEEVKEKARKENNMIIFIKGKEKYIEEMNQNIEKWIPEERNVKIIDCYSIDEIGERLDNVMEQYNKVLKTTGEKEIEKI